MTSPLRPLAAFDPVAVAVGETSVAFEVDTTLVSVEAIRRAAYRMTERCYVFLRRGGEDRDRVTVVLRAKRAGDALDDLAGELANDLIDQQLRCDLARETATMRDLIVAQAFAEGNLLDPERDEADYEDDPRGIGDRR